ncbi:alpha/beta hydrolase [Bacteroides sp. 224]|uniref:alpha/beta hydrolase n=1 Tax=Bacteroides sp. 224 TaxID=2302936 RepID=UPI0013D5F2C3|nr:alpha/beta hydrolase [Bacteroides sp. 224]NDV64325.1 alpha/beta hydrolase [Bacteroides sp. 224]
MKKVLLMTLLGIATSIMAQKPITLPLWAEGAPNTNGQQGNEQNMGEGRVANITDPSITVYKAENPNGTAIIMCPGGGYARLAMNHEGHDMASWFNSLGITYVVLKYRMPNGNHQIPLSDAEQAIRIVRKHASEWNIDLNKVGIMGASAGGHLASTLATHYSSKETRPDFQILLYPVITMDKSYTHGGSRLNLLGKEPSKELETLYSNELQVNSDTPQAFITLSSDDRAVPAANGVNYYLALVNHKVPVALHAYPTGGHGWGFRDNFIYKRQWTEELEKWIRAVIQP